ncbi:UDP-N-acetylmuramoyl-tripeptide--D-alanyl-D-alanine ligase [Fulvivirgaceae bacterium BMA12]|uniref:UDP-N-acetylmuramoyl-tripeptide--D-alanyl-D-alanine ligase n=1 Tax=Agaribacillus aureus TaxID=3051825 RepID=A0ABT8LEC0_9BACT|nr:UDP-N-acetylmuramoyl-tripeptide--D-alanyl-D-alanine ligase [Fulvivirgaceae bacterium BMA12]
MIASLYEKFLTTTGASTDTRNIKSGNIFFALKGPNFDANKFAKAALEQGAKYAVIDDPKHNLDDRYILVDDTLKALQDLAIHHRAQLQIPVIGITGSNGKTTTKELIYEVLSKKFVAFATAGNFNNHIGVPLSVLSVDVKTEIAVIEMGANKVGDIAELCEIAQPTHGLITNIGKAHIEGFGGFEGVIRGKSELYQYLIDHNGKVFINSENEILNSMAKRFERPYFYPAYSDYYHCELVTADPFLVIKSDKGNLIETNLVGKYNFENIAAALCIGKFFEVDDKKANRAISKYTPTNNRSQIIKKGNNMLILDAYNANPVSMKAAIENIAEMEASNKVVILGDMNELGEISEEEHYKVGELTKDDRFSKVIFCGEKILAAKNANPDSTYFKEKNQLIDYLHQNPFDKALILIKASRSLGLEQLAEEIKK